MWTVLWRLDNNKYSPLLATLNTDIRQNIIDLGCISQFVISVSVVAHSMSSSIEISGYCAKYCKHQTGWTELVPSATLIIHFLRGCIISVAGILNGPPITVVLFVFGPAQTPHYPTTVSSQAPASRTVLPTTSGPVSALEGDQSGLRLSRPVV